ncbi:MAG: hypothetical protein R3F56_19590 [Planctomycetota bacterium]
MSLTPHLIAMKQATLLAATLLACAAPAAAQWTDNFETYTANQALDNVGGWFGWDNTPAAAASVDGSRSRSFPNSLLVSGTTDAVHPQLGATAGKWRFTAWNYIPAGGLAGGDVYFILNNVYNHGGPYSWTVELKASGTTIVDDLRAHTPQPLVFDQWVEVRVDIDLDTNTIAQYYNGALISSGVYAASGPLAVANVDLFSTGGTCNWDDVSLAWRGDAFETYTAATVLDNVGGWFGWDNTPAAAGTADNSVARSAPNSLRVSGTTDAVHPQIGIAGGGRWIVSAWQYLATGSLAAGDAYFILNNVYNHGGPYSWTTELKCSGTTIVDDLRAHTPQPLVFDQWVEVRVEIDLDANTVKNFYNGALISQGTYAASGPRAVANIDLFSTGGLCNWDDITFTPVAAPPCYETNLGTALNMIDDSVSAQTLGFTFPYPGGSTTSITICANGFIWLDSAQTNNDWANSVAKFLGSSQATPRICAAWRDFNPAIVGADDVYFNQFADRAVVTWHNIYRLSGSTPMTVQCQMLADGSVYVYYDVNYDTTGGTANSGRTLTGIKAATGTVTDPGATDISASLPVSTAGPVVYEYFADSALFDLQGRCVRFEPNTAGGYDVSFRFDCGASASAYGTGCPASAPLTMTTSAPPVIGSTFTWDVTNVPTNTTAAALMLATGNANVSLSPFGFTGCSSYTTMDLPVALPFTPPTAQLPGTVPVNVELVGLSLYSQAVVVENMVTVYTSNGVALTFGKN